MIVTALAAHLNVTDLATTPKEAQRKAEAHGLPKAYATAAELIADPDIDIVLNLTLPAVHAELTTMALKAGKHVHTEKPLAATYGEGKRILALARERGLSVCCAPDTILGGRLHGSPSLFHDALRKPRQEGGGHAA